jgi:hypothetical protein
LVLLVQQPQVVIQYLIPLLLLVVEQVESPALLMELLVVLEVVQGIQQLVVLVLEGLVQLNKVLLVEMLMVVELLVVVVVLELLVELA